jgi:hypothetical protein
MKKIIKQLGNSIGITFNKEEKEIYELNIDDIVNIEVKKIK